jgi:hypothetical protein
MVGKLHVCVGVGARSAAVLTAVGFLTMMGCSPTHPSAGRIAQKVPSLAEYSRVEYSNWQGREYITYYSNKRTRTESTVSGLVSITDGSMGFTYHIYQDGA